MAAAVKASKDGDRVVRLMLPAVWVSAGADVDEVLAAHPLNQVEQMHPHVEDDAALRDVQAPRRPRSYGRGAFEGERHEPSEPPGTHDLARPHGGCVEAELMGDAQDHAGVAAGGNHLTRLRYVYGEWLLAQHVLPAACGGEHGRMMQRVRQGNVDRVDARVVHQRVEVVVDALDAEALRERAPLGK